MKIVKTINSIILCILLVGSKSAFAQSLKSQACTPLSWPDYEVATYEEIKNTPFVLSEVLSSKIAEGGVVVVNCRVPSIEIGFGYAIEDLEPLFSLSYDEYLTKLLGYRTDSLSFLSYDRPRQAGIYHELLSAIGTRDLRAIFKIPLNKPSFGTNGAIGYKTVLPGKPGDVVTFSGKDYNYEVYYNGYGQIELYYQSKHGGTVHTADCRNEGTADAMNLARNVARDFRNFIDEWHMQQCASYCTKNQEHQKKCQKIISSSYQNDFIYRRSPWK